MIEPNTATLRTPIRLRLRVLVVADVGAGDMIKRMKMIVGFSTLAAIVVLFCPGCAVCHYYGRIDGTLLDARNDKAIRGAAVVGIYRIEHGTVGGIVEESVDAVETTTDSRGRFLLHGKFVLAPRLPISGYSKQPAIYIFAPGYESVALTRDQAYSHVDQTNVSLTATTYRTIARPIVSVANTHDTCVYEFRVSPTEAGAYEVNSHFVDGPATKFPKYLKLLNTERAKYGLPEWHGWKK